MEYRISTDSDTSLSSELNSYRLSRRQHAIGRYSDCHDRTIGDCEHMRSLATVQKPLVEEKSDNQRFIMLQLVAAQQLFNVSLSRYGMSCLRIV